MILRIILFVVVYLFISAQLISQNENVGIGTPNPHNSAILHLESQNQGFLPPSMNQTQRDAILNPVAGLIIFNSNDNQLNYFNGTSWTILCAKSLVINEVQESIDLDDLPEINYTLTTDYTLAETASISVDIPGTVIVKGEMNLEPSNNVDIIFTYSMGEASTIPATSRSTLRYAGQASRPGKEYLGEKPGNSCN